MPDTPESAGSSESTNPWDKAADATGIKRLLRGWMAAGSDAAGVEISEEGTEDASERPVGQTPQTPPKDRNSATLPEVDQTPRPGPSRPSTHEGPPASEQAQDKEKEAPTAGPSGVHAGAGGGGPSAKSKAKDKGKGKDKATAGVDDGADGLADDEQEEEEVASSLFTGDQIIFMEKLADRAADRAARRVLDETTPTGSRKRTASSAGLNTPTNANAGPSSTPNPSEPNPASTPSVGGVFGPRVVKKRKERGKSKLSLERRVRDRTTELLGNPKPFGRAVNAERKTKAADVFKERTVDPGTRQGFKFDLTDLAFPDGFSLENDFALEYVDRPQCPWNMLMVQLSVEDFVQKHPDDAEVEVEHAFWAHIKHVIQEQRTFERDKREAAQRVTDLSVVRAERKTRNRRSARPKLMFERREASADNLPQEADPFRLMVEFVRALTKKGMSDDESDGEGGRIARRPIWRAAIVREWLTLLDFVGRRESELKRTLALDQRGRRPDRRLPLPPTGGAELVNAQSPAVRGLPRNLYDATWLASQPSAYIQRQVCPRDAVFAVPTEFLSYIASLNAAGPAAS